MNVLDRLRQAFAAATPEGADRQAFAAAVRAAGDPKFGDYQANGCMAIAKSLKQNPREVAQAVAAAVDLAPLADRPEVAGPGFLNVRLHDEWLSSALGTLLRDEALGIVPPAKPKTVIVDFSSPNVAKPMHVGHIRSTVIGDSLARIFAALGHKVVRDNHLGDWGSQFGMILWGWKNHRDDAAYARDPVAELARLYRLAQSRANEEDSPVEEAARAETAKLHEGDSENLALWEQFMPHCLRALEAIYERLGVTFDVQLGESFYNPMLAGVVQDLESKAIAEASEGATVVFVEGMKAPFIVRKSDGAFNYATTDLATIEYREQKWRPDAALYVVDHRQSDHFKQLFAVARRWGYDRTDFEHVAFGTILGPNRRPFKTREGDTVGLESLLDEAVTRARVVVDENSPALSSDERAVVAEAVGIGAIKYADLCQNRLSDYVFDWDKMLATNGNAGAYLQYAYARIQSIFRKGEFDPSGIRAQGPTILLSHPAERAIAVQVLRLTETLELAAAELKPNILTDYLFDLANKFSTFFDECPVLKAESSERRDSRLALCDLTARTLKFGLNLLGINVIDRM
jgi:arginyl-tRNA synthetase